MNRTAALFLALMAVLPPSSGVAGPADAVVRISSHGGSGTAIATGEGWTLVLSCAHCFEGRDRTKPASMDFLHHAAATGLVPREDLLRANNKKVGVRVVLVGSTNDGPDLALLKLNYGPVPYVSPVAPLGTRPSEIVSAGFDEMKFPMTVRKGFIKGARGVDYLTDIRPWHGRSGGGLFDAKTGYLVGVCSAYEGPRDHRELHPPHHGVFVGLPAIHRFLAKAGVMGGSPAPLPDLGSPSPFVQPQQIQRPAPRPQPGGT